MDGRFSDCGPNLFFGWFDREPDVCDVIGICVFICCRAQNFATLRYQRNLIDRREWNCFHRLMSSFCQCMVSRLKLLSVKIIINPILRIINNIFPDAVIRFNILDYAFIITWLPGKIYIIQCCIFFYPRFISPDYGCQIFRLRSEFVSGYIR